MKKSSTENFFIVLILATSITSCKTLLAAHSLKTGLIAYYPLNNSGTDVTGHGHNGIIYNLTPITNRNGKANSAYYFDGTSSYISVKDKQDLRLNNTDFTINTWVKIDSYNPSSGSNIVSKRAMISTADGWGTSITGYAINNNIGKPGLIFFGPGGIDPFGISNQMIGVNTWYMVTIVYSVTEQKLRFYINGQPDGIKENIASPNAAIDADMYIGRDNPESPSNGYFFKGALDDIRIYNRALTNVQIRKLYKLTN